MTDETHEANERRTGAGSYAAGHEDVRRIECGVLHEDGCEVVELLADDVPGLDGNPPQDGDHAWKMCIKLHGGGRAHLTLGPRSHRAFTAMLAAEATDDAEEQMRPPRAVNTAEARPPNFVLREQTAVRTEPGAHVLPVREGAWVVTVFGAGGAQEVRTVTHGPATDEALGIFECSCGAGERDAIYLSGPCDHIEAVRVFEREAGRG